MMLRRKNFFPFSFFLPLTEWNSISCFFWYVEGIISRHWNSHHVRRRIIIKSNKFAYNFHNNIKKKYKIEIHSDLKLFILFQHYSFMHEISFYILRLWFIIMTYVHFILICLLCMKFSFFFSPIWLRAFSLKVPKVDFLIH